MNIFTLPKPDKYGRRLAGFVKTTYRLVFLVLILNGVVLMSSIAYMFEGKASVYVKSNIKNLNKEHKYNDFTIALTKEISILTLSSPNIIENIFLKHKNGKFDFLHYLISFLGTFQILVIFKSLDQHGFFSIEIAKHIKRLAYIYIIGSFVIGFKIIYLMILIKDLTHSTYKLDTTSLHNSFNDVFFGFVLLLIAAIYKKACQLKEDQELTI